MWSAVSRCSDEGQVRQLREPFPLQVEHSAEHATHVGACVYVRVECTSCAGEVRRSGFFYQILPKHTI
jgi:DnaJ-class molecular chaperone